MKNIAEQIVDVCVKSLRSGGKIFFCGNGGSAADAQHLAAELVGKLNYDRPPLAAIALTANTSVLTAIANDYGYEEIFARQLEALGNAGDVLFAISTSGNSVNVLRAMESARNYNITIICMTGANGGKMASTLNCDILYKAPAADTQTIQEHHISFGHTICGMIEKEMFPR